MQLTSEPASIAKQLLPSAAVAAQSNGGNAPSVMSPPSAIKASMFFTAPSVDCYMIEQELGNLLPFERPFATLLTMIEVDAKDPAFANPTKFIGPVYGKDEADRLAGEKGWASSRTATSGAASPEPKRIFEMRPIRWLLERHTVVIAAGGGGIPAVYEAGADRKLVGRMRHREGPR